MEAHHFEKNLSTSARNNGIWHELSAPYNPKSNGLDEAAVKNLKSIVLRCKEKEEVIRNSILTWRNMVRVDETTHAQLFAGRVQKTISLNIKEWLGCSVSCSLHA